MSWYEENYIEPPDYLQGEYQDDTIFKKYLTGNLYWETKNGNKIPIQDLSISHINNILKMNFPNKENWKIILEFELNRRNGNV